MSVTQRSSECLRSALADQLAWSEIVALLNATSALSGTEAGYLDGSVPGTVVASKTVVVDANKDAGDFRNLDCVNLDAGSSGAAGTIDVFPGTALRGKFQVAVTDQTGNTTVTLQVGAMGQATAINLPDPGAAAAYLVMGTAQITLAEANVLDGATAGTAVASKVVVLDASKNFAGAHEVTLGTNGATGAAAGKVILRDGGNPGYAVTLQTDAQSANLTVHTPDPGAIIDAFVALSTAALTAAEVDVLDGATAGTPVASKAVIADANQNIGATKVTSLSIGATGSETLISATPAQLNALAGASAGIAAVLAGGLGGSHSVLKTEADTHTVIAAHGTKDRACLVVVVVDETYAVNTGTLPTVEVGEDDTIDKVMAHTVLTNQAAGTTLVYAFTNLATKKVIVTTTAAVGDSTGGCTVTVIAIPTT